MSPQVDFNKNMSARHMKPFGLVVKRIQETHKQPWLLPLPLKPLNKEGKNLLLKT